MPRISPNSCSGAVFLFLLSGCAVDQTNRQSLDLPDDLNVVAIMPDRAERPHWLLQPPVVTDRNIRLVVSASVQPFGGLDAQRRAAMLRARAEIAQMKKVYVLSTDTLSETVKINTASEVSHSNHVRQSARDWGKDRLSVAAEWQDPDSGELFLLITYTE